MDPTIRPVNTHEELVRLSLSLPRRVIRSVARSESTADGEDRLHRILVFDKVGRSVAVHKVVADATGRPSTALDGLIAAAAAAQDSPDAIVMVSLDREGLWPSG
jgi:hypothetical protein